MLQTRLMSSPRVTSKRHSNKHHDRTAGRLVRDPIRSGATPLARALEVLEVLPFTSDSVAAYQAAVVKTAEQRFKALQREAIKFRRRRAKLEAEAQEIGFNLLGVLVSIVVISLCTAGLLGGMTLYEFGSLPLLLVAVPLGVAMVFSALYAWRKRWLTGQTSISGVDRIRAHWDARAVKAVRLGWKTSALEQYAGEVPERARWTAGEIARHCPAARFEIEHTEVLEMVPVYGIAKVVLDPFLVAICGSERFYVQVWGEPDFSTEC